MPFCITFSGCVWSWKSPIASYISINLSLPVLNADSIRSEVAEDFFEFNVEIFNKRFDERLNEILQSWKSFIYDVSMDRYWPEIKKKLESHWYKIFIICLSLSKDFLKKLYNATSYKISDMWLDKLIEQNKQFIENHSDDIGITIDDSNYINRISIVYNSVIRRISKNYSIYTKSQTSMPYFSANHAFISNTNWESQSGV